jgi:hypothetical protein
MSGLSVRLVAFRNKYNLPLFLAPKIHQSNIQKFSLYITESAASPSQISVGDSLSGTQHLFTATTTLANPLTTRESQMKTLKVRQKFETQLDCLVS